jgi:hypothetical protein
MSNDNMEGGAGMPEAPAPRGGMDEDVNISRPGPKIALVIILLLVVGAGAYYWFGVMAPKRKLEEAINQFKTEFQQVHDNGYEAFWKQSQIDIKEMKNNQEFEVKVKQILSLTAVAYGKHLREKSLPILAEFVPKYKTVTAPAELATEAAAVAAAAETLETRWKDFVAQLDRYEEYLNAKAKLTEAGNHWLGLQGDPASEKFKVGGMNYLNLARCILVDKIAFEMDATQLRDNLENTCEGDEAVQVEWFRRVMGDCMPKLLEKAPVADDYFTKTIDKYSKSEAGGDTSSVFGVEACLEKGREALETSMAESLFEARVEYGKAQNALVKKIKDELEKLK